MLFEILDTSIFVSMTVELLCAMKMTDYKSRNQVYSYYSTNMPILLYVSRKKFKIRTKLFLFCYNSFTLLLCE